METQLFQQAAEEILKAPARAEDTEARWENLLRLDHENVIGQTEDDGLVALELREQPHATNLPNVFRRMSHVAPGLVQIFRELVTGKRPWPLYLHGPAGTGKTRAVLALCDFVKGSRYCTLREGCDDIMRGTANLPWGGGILEDAYASMFALDELGTRLKSTELEYTVLTEVFDTQERHARGVAVYVSNVAPADLARLYDDRIASRLLGGTVYRLDGPDLRQRTTKAPSEPENGPSAGG